jgi:hypothetical protein
MNFTNNNSRRFSMEDTFMKNKKINDILYGYLQSVSHLDKNNKRFVYEDKINFCNIEKILDNEMKHKTLSRNFKYLIETGFVEKGQTTDLYGNLVNVYFLPYTEKSIYQMINCNTLDYLIKGTNANVIKIYAYLLNKYNWKAKENKNYVFTKKELLQKVNSSTTNQRDYDKINVILDVLIKLKLIEIKNFYCENKNSMPTPKIRLIKVNENVIKAKY